MPAGRPTSLDDEVMEKARKYSSDFEKVKNPHEVVPSIAGLAVFLGVARKTISNWANNNEEFLHIVEGILSKQELMLSGGGLSGIYNASISKLLLTKHGYSDKQEVDSNMKVEGEVRQINRVIVDPKDESRN